MIAPRYLRGANGEDDHHRVDLPELLAEWHRYAQRTMEQVEFAKYYGSMDKEDFIREAVTPPPKFIADLTCAELKDALQARRSFLI